MAQQQPISCERSWFIGNASIYALLLLSAAAATAQDGTDDAATEMIQTPVGPVPAAPQDTPPAEAETVGEEMAPPEQLPQDEPVPGEGILVSRLEAQLALRDLIEERDFVEAVPVAERLAELTAEEFGSTSDETAVAISNLAEVQRRAGVYDESERNFLVAVELFRSNNGEFSETVITPLIGLGATYHDMGEYPESVTVFQEARTVNRRVYGLLNEDQIPILDRIASSMASMQQYEEADQQKAAGMRIMERLYGDDTLEILPAIYDQALWLRDGYRFQEERDLYSRAIGIIRDIEGRDSALLVRPLREVGNSFRVQKLPEGRGVSSLKRALEILQGQPEPDKLLMARVLRDIGDWSVAFSKVGPTGIEYREAWGLLEEVEDGSEYQRRWFTEPDYVLRENPSTRGLANPGDPGALPGHVLVTFDVLPSGRSTNVQVIESVPPGLKDESAARSVARSRFRPRMEDGQIVVAEGQARNFTYLYTLEEPEED